MSESILKTLIGLLEAQEGIKVEYQINKKEKEGVTNEKEEIKSKTA